MPDHDAQNLPQTNAETDPISLESVQKSAQTRPILVETSIVSEIQAESLLAPMDQGYSPSTQLYGIKTVYKYIASATRSVMNNYRTHLPTKEEIEESLRSQSFKFGDMGKIIDYLIRKTPPNPPFCIQYCAALYNDERLLLKPVYIAGNDSIEKVINKSDEISARNIVQKAGSSQPWADRTSHGEFLTKKINGDQIQDTYFLGYFRFDDQDTSRETLEIYEKRILPLLKGRSEILYLEAPLTLRSADAADEPIILVNDHRDLKFRYEFFCGKLIAGAKKILAESSGTEGAWMIRKAFESMKAQKTPEVMKQLAAGVLTTIRKKSTLRQIALEIYLMKNRAEELIRVDRETRESENKLYLDLLNKRIRTRKWLLFVPASHYPVEVFTQALSVPDVIGARKTAAELGTGEDYYCIIETQLIPPLLRTANWFELYVLESIMSTNRMTENPYYRGQIYRRKKSIVFLSTNPFLYLLRSILPGKRKYIENRFRKEVENRGRRFTEGLGDSLDGSGIHVESENASEKREKSKPSPKQLMMKKIIDIMFPDPAPSARWINEIEYREKLLKTARILKSDPEFPQYAGKTDEAIIADIEPFLREELIEDSYPGNLPTGLDHRGRKFTKKIYSPKSIKDMRIVYETIREELEHESHAFSSKDIVEYYKARARVFSEANMERIRSSDRLKKEAEQKDRQKKSGERVIRRDANQPPQTGPRGQKSASEKSSGGGIFRQRDQKKAAQKSSEKTANKSPKILSGQQKIERSAKTMTAEMKEKYITARKFTGSSLFPVTHYQLEELLDIEPGTLSLFSAEHSGKFSDEFILIRAGKQIYYFPKKFFNSNRERIVQYYQDLIKREESLPLPNGEIVHKASDILAAIRTRK